MFQVGDAVDAGYGMEDDNLTRRYVEFGFSLGNLISVFHCIFNPISIRVLGQSCKS